MKSIKHTAIVLVLAGFSMAAEASLVTWDFSWERTSRSNTYTGIGMFSYGGSTGDFVTQGGSWLLGDLNDELTAFSFEGFVNNVSIGTTNVLPSLFSFSPGHEFILGLKNISGQGVGVACLLNRCSLYEDGDRIRRSNGRVQLTQRDHGGGGGPTTSLPEPGLFGLTMIGMLFSLWTRRRGQQAAASGFGQ